MHLATVQLSLTSPYCQSRAHNTPKNNKELADDYERRTWRERLHLNEDGEIVIPSMAFANCIRDAASFLGLQIPGKGKSTWKKHFEAGIFVPHDVQTGKRIEDAIEHRVFVPSDGVRGSGKRVWKSYPVLKPPISVSVEFVVTDDMITPEAFAHHMQQAGILIGIGAFRKRNNGNFGMFSVDSINWIENYAQVKLPPINIIKGAA